MAVVASAFDGTYQTTRDRADWNTALAGLGLERGAEGWKDALCRGLGGNLASAPDRLWSPGPL